MAALPEQDQGNKINKHDSTSSTQWGEEGEVLGCLRRVERGDTDMVKIEGLHVQASKTDNSVFYF